MQVRVTIFILTLDIKRLFPTAPGKTVPARRNAGSKLILLAKSLKAGPKKADTKIVQGGSFRPGREVGAWLPATSLNATLSAQGRLWSGTTVRPVPWIPGSPGWSIWHPGRPGADDFNAAFIEPNHFILIVFVHLV